MDYQPTLTLGALGDSITTAFNALAANDNPAFSWATGTTEAGGRVTSHRRRLERVFPTYEIKAVNAAFAGARAAALPGQAEVLRRSAPDYVTMLIGANDLTSWISLGEYESLLDRFAADVRAAITALVATNPRIMILLAGIPDQSRVVDVLLRMNAPDIARLAPWLTPSVIEPMRKAYTERHERANRALEQIAAAHPGNVRFGGGLSRVRFSREHLSPLDSYHPSVEGQALLAEVSWQHGFFP